MNQIADEADAEQLLELKAQRRRQIFTRIRRGVAFCLFTAALATSFFYRAELQQFASEKFLNNPKAGPVDSTTSEALKGLQAHAEKRDKTLNDITK